MPVCKVSKVVGLVMSCLLAVGPSLILLCRFIYAWIDGAKSFDGTKAIGPIRSDLEYLRSTVPAIHGYPFQPKELVQLVEVVFSGNTSGTSRAVVQIACTGSGDHLSPDGPCSTPIFVQELRAEEAGFSSTWRLRVLVSLYVDQGQRWKGKTILQMTHSTTSLTHVRRPLLKSSLRRSGEDMAGLQYRRSLSSHACSGSCSGTSSRQV